MTDKKSRVRCNRENPCDNCVQRGENCTYAAHSRTGSRRTGYGRSGSDNSQYGLIDPLRSSTNTEGKISHMANQMAVDIRSPSHTPASVESSAGHIQVKTTETSYVGGVHWADIADNVRARHLDPVI